MAAALRRVEGSLVSCVQTARSVLTIQTTIATPSEAARIAPGSALTKSPAMYRPVTSPAIMALS